jgi:hypothetical protein
MEAVPAVGGGLQQPEISQFLQGVLGLCRGACCQYRGERGARVVARHQGQPPEQAASLVGQLVVGEPEGRGHRQVAGGEVGQPPPGVAQPGGQVPRGPPRTAEQPAARDSQRHRKVPAQLADLGDRGLVRGRARADDGGQQVRGIGGPHGLEHQPAEVLEAGQRAAAGDHDQAGAPARQQVADLAFGRGVVQDDQGPALAQQTPQPFGPILLTGRYPALGHAQGPEQAGSRLGRAERLIAQAAQVHEEAAVAERAAQDLRRPDRQRGLAGAGRARDQDDRAGLVLGGRLLQGRHLAGPGGEVGRAAGQFAEPGRPRRPPFAGRGGRGEDGVTIRRRDAQCVDQASQRAPLRGAGAAAFHVADRAGAHAGGLGHLLQRHARRPPVTAQQCAQRHILRHPSMMPPGPRVIRWRVR